MALAEFNDRQLGNRRSYETAAYIDLAEWSFDQGSIGSALESLRSAVELNPNDVRTRIRYGEALIRAGNFPEAIRNYDYILKMKKLEIELRISALLGRGVVKREQGDIDSAIKDFSTVIDLDDAPVDQVSRATLFRGVANGQQGDIDSAIKDCVSVIESLGIDSQLRALALTVAISNSQILNNKTPLNRIIASGRHALRQIDKEEKPSFISDTLHLLASPETRCEWLQLFEQFAGESTETYTGLEFFRPIALVLESDDRSHLDPLPPEHRKFAEEVLAKFEPQEVSERG